jgi:hypothetical protein
MRKMAYGLFGGLLALMIGLAWLAPVQASPQLQLTDFPTPTPGPDGRILYQVQEGDTLWRIASVTGVDLDELRQLNNLGVDDVIIPGQYLLLGLAGPVEATTEPGATGQPGTGLEVTPSPTPIMDSSAICVLLYLDVNGDAIRQGEEITMADGEVSVTERLGNYSEKGTTTFSPDPLCFENIPPGSYNLTMAIPEGYNRTTDLSATVELVPGDTAFLNFGMQPSSSLVEETGEQTERDSNMLIGILGVTLLVLGAGAGIYAATIGRSRFSEGD